MTMPITTQGRLDQFQDHGFIVRCNPKGDGNYQFSAASHLLNTIGLHTGPRILRQNVVEYLRRIPTNNVGQPLQLFVGRSSDQQTMLGNLCSYLLADLLIKLHEKKQVGTYEDQITLQAISNIYTIQTYVLSTLGVDLDVHIQPHINSSDNVQNYPHAFVGHCAEVQVEYYVTFLEELKDHIDFFPVQKNLLRSEAKADESALDKSPYWRNVPDEI